MGVRPHCEFVDGSNFFIPPPAGIVLEGIFANGGHTVRVAELEEVAEEVLSVSVDDAVGGLGD